MPRYLIERTFPEGLQIPPSEDGVQICHTVIANNTTNLVTWIHSYVTPE